MAVFIGVIIQGRGILNLGLQNSYDHQIVRTENLKVKFQQELHIIIHHVFPSELTVFLCLQLIVIFNSEK